MRRALIVALLALSHLSLGQADKWPQPIVKGTVIVWGGEEGKVAAKEAFIQLARNKSEIVVFAKSNEEWKEVPSAKLWNGITRRLPENCAIWVDSGEALASLEWNPQNSIVALSASSQSKLKIRPLSLLDGLTPQIDSDAALVATDRNLVVRGTGSVTFTLPKSLIRSEGKVTLQSNERADIVALLRRAVEQSLPEFPPKQSDTPEVKSGSLFIVGGGGMPQGLLQKFIEACGGPDAAIVYVPCEFAEVIPTEPDFVRALKAAGAKNVSWIHTKDREKSDKDDEFLKPLKDAKGVWFGGGRQWNLVDSYADTQAHELMKKVLERGGAIGGSSAGASIQAEFLARGNPLGNLEIVSPGYTRGLGFLPGAAVDQHFTQRGRHKDMTSLMKTHPQLLGIGIDEATAIIVKGTTAEVTGRGSVFFYDYRTAPTTEQDYLALKQGEKYDLKERKRITS